MSNRVLIALIVAIPLAFLFFRDGEQVTMHTVTQMPQIAPDEEALYSAYETLLNYEPDTTSADIAVNRNIFRTEHKTERKMLPVRPIKESSAMPVSVVEPELPPFSLTGQIVENGSESVTLILSDGTTAQLGDTVKGRWQLRAVEGNALLCEDLSRGIVHKLHMGEPISFISDNNKSERNESVDSVRSTAPITYKELLRRRAEIQNAKKK